MQFRAKSCKNRLTRIGFHVILNKCLGVWCNGNTWVSKTFVEGSSPSAPAKRSVAKAADFFICFLQKDENRTAVNTVPFGTVEPS